jgi:cell division protein FtsQ
MDGRGRLAESLTWLVRPVAHWRAWRAGRDRSATHAPGRRRFSIVRSGCRIRTRAERGLAAILDLRVPAGLGWAASGLFFLATLSYGVVAGGHYEAVLNALRDGRDAMADAAGFAIASIAVSGERHVGRDEILATIGVTERSSLLFLDVEGARDRLKTNPWIADATVLKLYPDRLQIGIKERAAFALWQQGGRVSVIAEDGTVLEPYIGSRLNRLPLVVGQGAAARAKPFLARLDAYPELRERVRASVLIGERRWNLRLKNGLDIRLPENGIEAALATLLALDRDKKLLSRDLVAIDLRLPDRVTVELTESAAAARAEALKDKKPAKKGGNA